MSETHGYQPGRQRPPAMRGLRRALVLAVVLPGLVMAGPAPAADGDAGPQVGHVVLVWLKQPDNAEHRQRVIEASKRFEAIPGVRDLRVGRVIPGERDVVEDSYDVALYMRFASRADQQAYLEHPLHAKIVANQLKPVMARYRVMDFRIE